MIKNGMRPIHPGEILLEEFLQPLGMTPHALSKHLKVTPSKINDIVLERRGVTAETALRLARFFDTSPQFWLNLQSSYDLRKEEIAHLEEINNQVHPYEAVFA